MIGPPYTERWSDKYPFPGWWAGRAPRGSDATGLAMEFDAGGKVRRAIPLWQQ
jgi:hypothetical protein